MSAAGACGVGRRALSFESLAQVLELERCPEPGRLHEVGNELHDAGAGDREPAMNDDLVAESQWWCWRSACPRKRTHLAPVVITQAEVDVSSRRATHIADFTFQPEILIEGPIRAPRGRGRRMLRPGEAPRSSAIAPTNPKAHQW